VKYSSFIHLIHVGVTTRALSKTFFNLNNIDDDDPIMYELIDDNDVFELYADKFSYIRFLEVWNKLKENKLI
jgi:hypothetical protein